MAMTLRLPSKLKSEADAFAARLGISVNALVAVALREYLDGRRTNAAAEASLTTPPAPPRLARHELEALQELLAAPEAPPGSVAAPKNRAGPCPCGSLDLNGRPMRWTHCHGKAPPA